MLVYREAAECVPAHELLSTAINDARSVIASPRDQDAAITALISAGALECAALDVGSPSAGTASLTDSAAAALAGAEATASLGDAITAADRTSLPCRLRIRPFEGFAYYALHPYQYIEMARRFVRRRNSSLPVAVVGIRSIGVPLSALVAAAVRGAGGQAERITVRPDGHPSNRELRFTSEQSAWVRRQAVLGADFLVADEGPGRSGSSFLATAEALEREGVSHTRISLLCNRAHPGYASGCCLFS